jgi:hypothetical protein
MVGIAGVECPALHPPRIALAPEGQLPLGFGDLLTESDHQKTPLFQS